LEVGLRGSDVQGRPDDVAGSLQGLGSRIHRIPRARYGRERPVKGWQLTLAAALYVWSAIDFARDGRAAMCAAFVCYAIANIAFAIDQANG
jgi:hypothetical protein